MGSKVVGAQGYRERTAYMIKNTDCMVAVYDELQVDAGIKSAQQLAKERKMTMIQNCARTGKVIWKPQG